MRRSTPLRTNIEGGPLSIIVGDTDVMCVTLEHKHDTVTSPHASDPQGPCGPDSRHAATDMCMHSHLPTARCRRSQQQRWALVVAPQWTLATAAASHATTRSPVPADDAISAVSTPPALQGACVCLHLRSAKHTTRPRRPEEDSAVEMNAGPAFTVGGRSHFTEAALTTFKE